MKDDHTRMQEAITSLHEQAHGDAPIRFCQTEPCRSLHLNQYAHESGLTARGPAPHNPAMF